MKKKAVTEKMSDLLLLFDTDDQTTERKFEKNPESGSCFMDFETLRNKIEKYTALAKHVQKKTSLDILVDATGVMLSEKKLNKYCIDEMIQKSFEKSEPRWHFNDDDNGWHEFRIKDHRTLCDKNDMCRIVLSNGITYDFDKIYNFQTNVETGKKRKIKYMNPTFVNDGEVGKIVHGFVMTKNISVDEMFFIEKLCDVSLPDGYTFSEVEKIVNMRQLFEFSVKEKLYEKSNVVFGFHGSPRHVEIENDRLRTNFSQNNMQSKYFGAAVYMANKFGYAAKYTARSKSEWKNHDVLHVFLCIAITGKQYIVDDINPQKKHNFIATPHGYDSCVGTNVDGHMGTTIYGIHNEDQIIITHRITAKKNVI